MKYIDKKINKGYTEITEYKRDVKVSGVNKIDNINIRDLVTTLVTKSRNSVKENYLVGFDQVTNQQIVEAQNILDSILEYKIRRIEVSELNRRLLKLYRVIPRKMKKVQDYLIKDFDTTRIKEIVAKEQELLDNLKTQVTQGNIDADDNNILETAGLTMEDINDDEKKIILDKLGNNAHQFKRAFKVTNKNTQEKYNQVDIQKTELFWHGSRTENWWSIISNGLMIRPTGVVTTGAMFGTGIYFADKAQKSIGYTSLNSSYWARGNDTKAYLALFEVKVGKQKDIHKHTCSCYDLNYNKIKSEGYDSVFAHAGSDLRNNEYIVYKAEQVTIKYIVEIGA